ncbi:MAG: hypothetical protein AAGJ35_10665, partial [Myxococcota bacterium]
MSVWRSAKDERAAQERVLWDIRPVMVHTRSFDAPNVVLSVLFCLLCCVSAALLNADTLHWFLLPVFMSGVLCGYDALRWLRGQVDLFDPVGVVGMIAFHLFFISPLYQVTMDFWMHYPHPPSDWREWVGSMAIWNMLGLILYRMVLFRLLSRTLLPKKRVMQFDRRLFGYVVLAGLALTLVLQVFVYARVGGVRAYIGAAFDKQKSAMFFRGMGWVFMISESFPILLAFA